MGGKHKNALKWTRPSSIQPSNHIVSSKARELGDVIGFKPTYETTRKANMFCLLSFEYQRVWFHERKLYEKENYAKQQKGVVDQKAKRRFVQRMMVNPKKQIRELPGLAIKKFQDIAAKVNTNLVGEVTPCERYKRSMEPTLLTRYKPLCATTTKPEITNSPKPKKPATSKPQLPSRP